MIAAKRARVAKAGPSRLHLTVRVTAAIFGAYGFAWGLAAFGAEFGVLAGLPPAEAVTASSLLTLVVLPVASLWAFAVTRALAGWAVLGGGGLLMLVASWLAGGALP